MTELDQRELVVADAGAVVEWDSGWGGDLGLAGGAGKADVCGETSKQVWAIRW